MKNELKEIKKGTTWQNIYDALWHIATVRYATYKQMKGVFPDAIWRGKCITPKKINILVREKYLQQSDNGVIAITSKALEFLKNYSNYNTDIIK